MFCPWRMLLAVSEGRVVSLSTEGVVTVVGLEAGLLANFSTASVEVVDCPDLTHQPWSLASQGLCGSPRLLDIGGVPFLMPLVMRDKLYDMKDYPRLTGSPQGLVIGAGAGPWPFLNRNAEMMPNMFVNSDNSVKQVRKGKPKCLVDGTSLTLTVFCRRQGSPGLTMKMAPTQP